MFATMSGGAWRILRATYSFDSIVCDGIEVRGAGRDLRDGPRTGLVRVHTRQASVSVC